MYKYRGPGNNGQFAWLMQRISGLVMVALGAVVFYQLTFGEGSHALDAWLLLPVLVFGIWHTFSGFKMITDDYVENVKLRFILNVLYWFIGVALLSFGLPMI
jgi:succinate dehydrogenase / fumarate reductase membrane anchor subunit